MKELNALMILLAEKVFNNGGADAHNIDYPVASEGLPLLGLPITLSDDCILIFNLVQLLGRRAPWIEGCGGIKVSIDPDQGPSLPDWEIRGSRV